MTNFRGTQLRVNLNQIESNFRSIRSRLGEGQWSCPMIKATAYGHGAGACARALRQSGANARGVALIEEAVELRQAGDTGPILVFAPFDLAGAREIKALGATAVVSNWHQLETLAVAAADSTSASSLASHSFEVHLEFDTGMSRLGFSPADAEPLSQWFSRQTGIVLEGICTHFLRGQDLGASESRGVESRSEQQLQQFAQVHDKLKKFNPLVHVLNSASAASAAMVAEARSTLQSMLGTSVGSRPGLSVYGIDAEPVERSPLGVANCLTWSAPVVEIRSLNSGATVSYEARWRALRPSTIAVLPVGYADGLRRALTNRGEVLLHGIRAPIVGVVCMDYCMIDITDVLSHHDVKIGDSAVLLGSQTSRKGEVACISVQEMADCAGVITYEITTGISSRVPRVYESLGDAKVAA
jgi:alanine racemase